MTLCFVSIGSNVERETHVRNGIAALRAAFGPLLLSSIYETEPVGFSGAPFLNLVAGFATNAAVADVAHTLSRIENDHGRRRDGERFGPRTLDLDLLLYGDLVTNDPELTLPRPEIARYAFILEPLAEIAPDLVHPTLKQRYATLWRARAQPSCGKKTTLEL